MRDAEDVLRSDGLILRDGARDRTTARWQAAMARAALRLQRSGAPWQDLRIPIASALLERYPDATDEDLAALVDAMVPVEEGELAAVWGGSPTGASSGEPK